MLLSNLDLKKVHIKFICITTIVTIISIIYYYKTNKFEKVLREYESKIIPHLGDFGEPAYLNGEDKLKGEKALIIYGLNTVLSDRMSLDRPLRDPRNIKCKEFKYHPTLKASIIVIFYNEHMSVVLRNLWSVILQTPSHLLHEIILVNDCSTDENLNGLLQHYIDTRLNSYNIKLKHLTQKSGLIRARLEGARIATGEVLVFLDAQCEVTKDWILPLISRIQEDRTTVVLPVLDFIEPDTFEYSPSDAQCEVTKDWILPLISRIQEDRTTVVLPVLDFIEPDTFEYSPSGYDDDSYQVGGFWWCGHFVFIDIENDIDKHKLSPIKSPAMVGGVFAIDRKFFWDIGSYDEQMDGWGGENLEMSFRIWQCGGRLETVPCSRIGHIFKTIQPYSYPENKKTHGINTARMAHVWMDDYKRLFFMYQPNLENDTIVGDLTERKQLRQKLGCKSFKWYLDNVYPEKFIPDENVYAHGQVRTKYDMCLDDLQLPLDQVGPLGLYLCHPHLAMSQYFSLSSKGELRKETTCAEVVNGKHVQLTECNGKKQEQHWIYFKNGTIYNSATNKCLTSEGVFLGTGIKVERCMGNVFQKWKFTNMNVTALGWENK